VKVNELIELLHSLDPDAEVLAWDPESGQEEPVVGAMLCKVTNIGPCVTLSTEEES
jgi:hypothetical protein